MATEAAVKKPITLTDGTVVEFTERQKMQLEVVTTGDGDFSYKAVFANGEVREGTIPGLLTEKLALHGLGQKLRDSISGEKTVSDAIGAFEDVAEVLEKGEWSIARTGGDGPKASKTELAQAIAAVRGIEVATAAAWLAGKTPAEKIKMRSVPAVALKIAELRAAAAAGKTAPTEDVFAGLE
jgi:hypothetical protein